MEDPQLCSVCQRPLRQVRHLTAHAGHMSWDAHMRTCPHNLGLHCFDGPRHDEWHRAEAGWIRREPE
jgi:hypothetical protein